jgi:hypothetical protein
MINVILAIEIEGEKGIKEGSWDSIHVARVQIE